MPTAFNDRERGFEAKFVHDEELRFRATARRDKLFAAWLSAKWKLSAANAHSLESAILAVPNGAAHDTAVLALVASRLARHSANIEHISLKLALEECAERAAEQLARGVN